MSGQRSDQDMDNEWKPNGRPQSTMARNFSDSLNSAFAIHDSTTTPQLEDLAQSVSQKKAAVDSQTSELQALEARIKEMDRRLEQKNSRTSSPAARGGQETGGAPYRPPIAGDLLGSSSARRGGNTPGAPGNLDGTNVIGSEDTSERKGIVGNSSPLADRTVNLSGEQGYADKAMKLPGGTENLSASNRSHWVPSGEGEAFDDVRE